MATRETGGERAAQDVKDVAATAKEDVRNAADRIVDRGRDEAKTILEQQQRRAADGLTGVADALHAAADRMEGSEIGFVARYAETAADQVETWARRVQQRDIDDVLSEAENYARRNPEIFVGGAFLAGFLVARVAKASSDRRRLRERVYREEMAGIGRSTGGVGGGSTGSGGPRGYGYAGGGYPGGIAAGADGPRGSTTTPGAADLTGEAALSAATGPRTPADIRGTTGQGATNPGPTNPGPTASGSPIVGSPGQGAGSSGAGSPGGGDLRQGGTGMRPGGGQNPHAGGSPEQRGGPTASGNVTPGHVTPGQGGPGGKGDRK